MALGSLVLEVGANVARFQSDMGKIAQIAEYNMRRVQQVSDAAANAAKAAFAGLAAGLTAGAFAAGIKGAIDMADHLNDLSKQTGVAVDVLGGMGYAASQAGADLDETAKGLGKLNLKIAEAAAGGKEAQAFFNTLGISVKTASGETKTADKVFAELAGKFETYKDGPNKAALANYGLGKSYMGMIPLLNDGRKALEDNIETFKRYGGVTEQVAARADQFNDTLEKIKLISGSFVRNLAAELLPAMQAVADEFLRIKENGSNTSVVVSGVRTVFETIAVVAANVAFVFAAVGREIGALAAQAAALARFDFKGFTAIGDAVKEDGVRARKELDALEARILQVGKAGTAANAAAAGGGKLGEAPPLPGKGASATEASPYTKFLQELDRLVEKTNEGEYAALRLKAAQLQAKEPALSLADAYKRIADIQAGDSQKAVSAFVRGLDDEANALALQINLLGKSADQQERLTFAFNKRLAAERAIEAAAKANKPLTDAAIRQLRDQTEETINYTNRLRDRERTLTRSPAFGANQAVQAYIDQATNAAKNAESLVGGSLSRIEDSIVNFVKTGKLSFSELFSFMAEEFLRQSIRMSVAQFIDPKQGGFDIGSLFSSGIGSIFGSIGGFFGTPLASGLDYVPYDGFPAILHQGERVQTAVEARGESRAAAPVVQIIGDTHYGSNISRAEVAAQQRASEARVEMRVRRLIQQGALA